MHKWIALGCVLGWSFFAVFGYIAFSSHKEPGDGALIAAELALYGLAVGSMTWSYLHSRIAAKRKPEMSRSVKDG